MTNCRLALPSPLSVSLGYGCRVELIDVMPQVLPEGRTADYAIVEAARVSYNGTMKSEEEDLKLLRYLLRNKHTSPFEMCELKFRLRFPVFVARQWVRHRTASLNECSARYTEVKDEWWNQETWYTQSESNKQGSGEKVEDSAACWEIADSACTDSFKAYQELLARGVSREDARTVLPLSMMTEWIWKVDLHNLMHFLKLRMHPHAQHQIREMATVLYDLTRLVFPHAIAAFDDYVLNSVTLSALEVRAMQTGSTEGMSKRELDEWKDKQAILVGSGDRQADHLQTGN